MNRRPNTIEPRFCVIERGHYAEVFGRRGALMHTTHLCPSREAALEAAKRWLKKNKKAKVS